VVDVSIYCEHQFRTAHSSIRDPSKEIRNEFSTNSEKQNPGYQVVYEFPNATIKNAADRSIAKLGLQGIVTTRVAGPR
jgi:hypothetical protein